VFAALLPTVTVDNVGIWSFVWTVLVVAIGGLLLRASYVKALKDTAAGWKEAYEQKVTELSDTEAQYQETVNSLELRLTRLQQQFDTQERLHRDAVHELKHNHQEVILLNVTLQLDIKEKNMVIEQLKGQISILEIQVQELQGKK